MTKYYELITFLNKLEYNLINIQLADKLLKPHWDDLIIIYKLMNNSIKFLKNINKLTKFIDNIINKFEYKINDDIFVNDDNLILAKLTSLCKKIIIGYCT